MPYWCANNIYIVGENETELENLYLKIQEWTRRSYRENGFGDKWLGNIVIGAGFSEETYECRGSITGDFWLNREDGVLEVQTETAWKPMNEMWHAVIEKYAPSCHFHAMSVEHGFGIYIIEEDKGFDSVFKNDMFVDFDETLDFSSDHIPLWTTKLMEEETFTTDYFRKQVVPLYGDISTESLVERCNEKLKDVFTDKYICIEKYDRYEYDRKTKETTVMKWH